MTELTMNFSQSKNNLSHPPRLFEPLEEGDGKDAHPPRLFEPAEQSDGKDAHPPRLFEPAEECEQEGASDVSVEMLSSKSVDAREVGVVSRPVTETMSAEWQNFSIKLEEIVEKIFDTPDGEIRKFSYFFKIFVGTDIFEETVNADDVANFKWVRSSTGGRAYIGRGKKGQPFDEYMSGVISGGNPLVRTIYNTNGWKKFKGNPVYIYDSGAIGRTARGVSGNKKHIFEFNAEKVGTYEIYWQTLQMLEICREKNITLPLFLSTHMGALTTLFEEAGFPIKFTISVIGKTNSRKTSLCLCMTKTINRRQITKPEVNFNATEGGIEKKIGLHSDAVLVIDDFMPALTKAKQRVLDTKLEKVLRIYGDREGIERMTDFARNPEAGYYPVRGIGVITGEHIRGVQSSLLRSLILEIDQDSVDNSRLAFFQDNYKILNTHLYDFLNFVAENYVEIVQFIKQRVEMYRSQAVFELPRYSEMYGQLMTTGEIFVKYALARNYADQPASQELLEEWREILRKVIAKNAKELREKDLKTVLKEVCVSIAEDGAKPLPSDEKKDYGDEVFEDETIIYIRLDAFLKKMHTLLSIWGIEVPALSKKVILDELEEAGLIETKGKAEGKRTLKLPGSKYNRQVFLYIKKSELSENTNEN